MDYAPDDPTPPLPPAPDSSTPPDAASDPNYAPSVEELLKDFPATPPLPKRNDPELRYMPKGSDGQSPVTVDDAWRKIHNLVEKYDKGMCESYREQIDTLLVFAGLFSAVITPFAVESYQWLQDDPADASAELLRQAVILLSTLANQTSSPAASQRGPALPESVVVRINVYWFLSLVFSLSAALIGIVCKQWLREYERDSGKSAQQALSVRQMKFEGLEAWRVGAIVTSVPLLLQLALALFLIGISELLWHLHRAVAVAVTTAAGFTGLFYLMTALAPLWQYLCLSILSRIRIVWRDVEDTLPGRGFTLPQCPYKSPQAWLALRLCQPVIDWILFRANRWRQDHRPDSWVSFDAYWTTRRDQTAAETTTSRLLLWTANVLGETHLNAWRVLCTRQHLAQLEAGGSARYRAAHAEELMQFLLPSLLDGVDGPHEKARLRKRAVLFSHSCRPDLDVNTSVELLLQLASNARFDSVWFSSGLDSIQTGFWNVQPKPTDDMAIEFLRVVQDRFSSHHRHLHLIPHRLCRVADMLRAAVNILNWAPSRTLFLPAVCAVAVRLLQSTPAADRTREHAGEALDVLRKLRDCVLPSSIEIRQLRGFGHIVALAQFMLDNDPTRINDKYVRKDLDLLGLSYLYEERLPRVQQRSNEDGLRSETVSEHAEVHLIPDVQLAPLSLSAVVSTATNSALVSDIRLPATEIPAAVGRGDGDKSTAPHPDAPDRLGFSTFGVSAASPVLRTDAGPAIELHDMPARAGAGDADDAARTDPRLGLEQTSALGGTSGVISTSVPPHIAIRIASPPETGASISGSTSTSHDPEAP